MKHAFHYKTHNMNTNNMITFGNAVQTIEAAGKRGGVATRILSGKEWKEINASRLEGMSNREKKAEYAAYVKTASLSVNCDPLISGIASQRLGVAKVKPNKDGTRLMVEFIDHHATKGAELQGIEKALANMEADEVIPFLEKMAALMKERENTIEA